MSGHWDRPLLTEPTVICDRCFRETPRADVTAFVGEDTHPTYYRCQDCIEASFRRVYGDASPLDIYNQEER